MQETAQDHAPVLLERPARPYVAIASRVASESGFRAAADRGFPQLFGWLGESGVEPAGPPFIRYHAFHPDGTPAHIEVAVPVAEPIEGEGMIEPGTLPAGPWLTYLHVGPYAHRTLPGLVAAHATIRAWAGEHGLALGGCAEHYRRGPVEDPDYTRWETEIEYQMR